MRRMLALVVACVLACGLVPTQALARTAAGDVGIRMEVPSSAFVDQGDGTRAADALLGVRIEVPSSALVAPGDDTKAADGMLGIRLEVPSQSYVDPGDGDDVRAAEGLLGIRLEVPKNAFVDPGDGDDVRAAEGIFGIRLEVPSAAFVEPGDDTKAADGLVGIRLEVPRQAYVEGDTKATSGVFGIRLSVATTHTVTFDANGGVGGASVTVLDGAAVEEPDPVAATKEGFRVEGWYLDAACTQRYDFARPVYGDFTLFAKWAEPDYEQAAYRLHVVGADAVVAADELGLTRVEDADDTRYEGAYKVGKGVTLPIPTRPGYEFVGWYAGYDAETGAYAGDPVEFVSRHETGERDYWAKWEPLPPPTGDYWTVEFDTLGGSLVEPQYVDKATGGTAERPADPVRSGYSFDGWYADSLCMRPFDFDAAIVADTTVYAGWKRSSGEPTTNYTVAFDSRGGDPVARQQVREGACATRPADPTLSGYDFVDWYVDAASAVAAGAEGVYDFATPVVGNVTLYAGWREKPKFDVTFYAAGGVFEGAGEGGVDLGEVTVRVRAGDFVPADQVPGVEGCAVAAPRRAGWQFSGWYPERADGSGAGLGEGDYEGGPFDFASTPIKGSTALYAKWTLRLDVTVPVSVAFAVDAATGEAAGPGADAYALRSRTVRAVEVESLALESRQGELEGFFGLAAGEEGGPQPTWADALAGTSLSLAPAGADAVALPFAGERAGDVWSTLCELGADERASWRLGPFDYGAMGATPDDAWQGEDPSVRLPLALALEISDRLEILTDLDGPVPITHLKVTVSAEA